MYAFSSSKQDVRRNSLAKVKINGVSLIEEVDIKAGIV